MKLNYTTYGKEGIPIIILHGLLGSLDNWATIGKALGDTYQVYLVDQRNHGKSPHDADFTYMAMVSDLEEFISEHDLDKPIIIGHSMGGKAAMRFAVAHPDQVRALVVVDIAPKYYPVHHEKILEGLRAIPVSDLKSRGEAEEILGKYIKDAGERQFLLKNLHRESSGFSWKMNLDVIEKHIENVGEALPENSQYDGPVLFVKGGDSDYIGDNDRALIKAHFPASMLVSIDEAGHWVHAAQPDAFLETLQFFLKNQDL